MDQVKFFKVCLPKVLLGLFLNTLTQLWGQVTTENPPEHSVGLPAVAPNIIFGVRIEIQEINTESTIFCRLWSDIPRQI